MKLRDRLAGIDANLDDVQAGAEACSRAADTLIGVTSRLNGNLKGPLAQALTRNAKDLQACSSDQRTALRELRASLALLRDELTVPRRAAIRPPPLTAANPDEA